ncbi:hypothetical protein HM1_1302 [Heliomicrobium modesticaldum Ice1]|uniref:Uncharacterized protein n=1 Tax=Heliobacterium modesticaldum (strain ATCC 51547 / Ice1) TaxID=498761 RepID=B0TGL3_HELMI|nr:hypothetical protein HM1_1302 [Heliomicrobium modesticaldum Ice1]
MNRFRRRKRKILPTPWIDSAGEREKSFPLHGSIPPEKEKTGHFPQGLPCFPAIMCSKTSSSEVC